MRRPFFVSSVLILSGALLAALPAGAQEGAREGGAAPRPLLDPDPGAGTAVPLRVIPPEAGQGAVAPDGGLVDAEPEVEGEGPVELEGEGGLTGEDVQESLPPPPTEQGTRPFGTLDEEDVPQLYGLLARIRAAPPSLEGEPVPRPNALASEPAKEMTPQQPADVSLFVEDYIE